MKYDKVISLIEKIAPPELAADWDNSGIQINTGKEVIENILTCLEINQGVINEAREKKIDMIVTHHPLIFSGLKEINKKHVTGSYILDLIKANISVYSAHISFDNAPLGNNYYMAEKIGLDEIRSPEKNPNGSSGLIGTFPKEKSLREACEDLEKDMNLPPGYIKIVGDFENRIKKVGLCTGGGDDFLQVAIWEECDLFITGDVKFHQAQYAKATGINLIDAGHYGTEKIFAENFATQLRNINKENLVVLESNSNTNPYMV